jgi:hypothetical protein
VESLKKDVAAAVEKQKELAPRAKQLTDKLVAVESEVTQIQGEGGQDALNFPGRIDNQWVVLYGSVANSERKVNKAITVRYADLKPPRAGDAAWEGAGRGSDRVQRSVEARGIAPTEVKPPTPPSTPQQ